MAFLPGPFFGWKLGRRPRVRQARLPSAACAGKAAAVVSEPASMVAILTIVIFLVVVAALNLYEFGRLD
jgi:hypothetical protein